MILRSRTLALLVASTFVLAAVMSGAIVWKLGRGEVHERAAEEAALYYCPMHPTITSDAPGNCPICGMSLIRRVATDSEAARLAAAGSTAALERISLSPTQRVIGNLATVPAEIAEWDERLTTTGSVTLDESRLSQVTAWIGGRIERLFVEFTGDLVRRGQPVALIYSPELYSTQQEYLLALANRERMRTAGFPDARSAADDLVDSTRRRLRLFGMSEPEIDELARNGTPFYTTTLHAPVSGIVVRKNVVPQQYVETGQPLLELADLSTVWVEADVYEKDLARIELGQAATIVSPAWPGRTFTGRVSFVEPLLSMQSRTNRVRIALPNPDMRLKPGMYVSVELASGADRGSAVMVPRTAVVDRGDEQWVWVEAGAGAYEPRRVTTGGASGERIAILNGLRAGENVVVQGGFLLDSEARLRQMTAGGGTSDDPHDH
ncbi:MAG TPA: efflux RND transporter periplasmic adaptor subunit [Thermoanaerobaculia bacterium]|nr:efflux RND transporter periplasmic adaptor subunit [Thermoanaerobaculia bacterium]